MTIEMTNRRLRRSFCFAIALAILLALLLHHSIRVGLPTADGLDSDNDELLQLVAMDSSSTEGLGAVQMKCPMYREFRNLDFQQPVLRHRLCSGVEAYRRYRDGYPLCQLLNPFNNQLLDAVRLGSEERKIIDGRRSALTLFVYKDADAISNAVREFKSWEPQLVDWTLNFAMLVPHATFLDIGSNIGVYSIQAAKLGLPVISLDANIRNLLRLRLSLNAASLNAALVWNFIAPDQNLKYLSFLADCNVGGAGRDKADLDDTVPVMPLRSERLCDLIKTKNVVMKMDIQGAETDFLLMSGRLFKDFKVAAVQMEWYPPMIRGNDSATMRQFFTSMGYKVWKLPNFLPLDPDDLSHWEKFIDVVWIHPQFWHLNA